MANNKSTRRDETPPGATAKAADRPIHAGGGPPGSGAGPRHAADDPGTPDEEYGAVDSNDPLADGTLPDPDIAPEVEPAAYAAASGAAIGGTPANKRAKGGQTHGGIRPAPARPDSTVGTDPESE